MADAERAVAAGIGTRPRRAGVTHMDPWRTQEERRTGWMDRDTSGDDPISVTR